MHFRPIALGLALSLVSGAAFAQTTAALGSDAMMAGPAITMGTAAVMPLKYVNVQDTDLVTSKLVGVEIYNKQNEDVGTISDIVIGGGKSVIGIVASVGGFLGMGESYVAIDPASVALRNRTVSGRRVVDTTKDQLSKARTLDYDKFKK